MNSSKVMFNIKFDTLRITSSDPNSGGQMAVQTDELTHGWMSRMATIDRLSAKCLLKPKLGQQIRCIARRLCFFIDK